MSNTRDKSKFEDSIFWQKTGVDLMTITFVRLKWNNDKGASLKKEISIYLLPLIGVRPKHKIDIFPPQIKVQTLQFLL